MKQNLPFYAALVIISSACQKDNPAAPVSAELFPDPFSIANTTQTVTDNVPSTKATLTTEDEFINHLWYFVYGVDGGMRWYRYQDRWEVAENDHFLLDYQLSCRTVRDYPLDANAQYEFDWLNILTIKGQFQLWTQEIIVSRTIVIPTRGDSLNPVWNFLYTARG